MSSDDRVSSNHSGGSAPATAGTSMVASTGTRGASERPAAAGAAARCESRCSCMERSAWRGCRAPAAWRAKRSPGSETERRPAGAKAHAGAEHASVSTSASAALAPISLNEAARIEYRQHL